MVTSFDYIAQYTLFFQEAPEVPVSRVKLESQAGRGHKDLEVLLVHLGLLDPQEKAEPKENKESVEKGAPLDPQDLQARLDCQGIQDSGESRDSLDLRVCLSCCGYLFILVYVVTHITNICAD